MSDDEDQELHTSTKALFNETLPRFLAKKPEVARAIGCTYGLVIRNVGAWHLDCKAARCVEVIVPPKTNCTITVGPKTFRRLMEDPVKNAMTLFLQGRIEVDGDIMLTAKLMPLLEALRE